ncbi:MAG: hypothetical protein AAF567_02725 [Actinomycetota bacterium]
MSRWKNLLTEWKARRAGRRGVHSQIHRAARDVTGPTGWVFSASFDKLDQHGDAYIKSFDRRIPPSIFVSERDRTRHNTPMPLAERCIEDHPYATSSPLPVAELEALRAGVKRSPGPAIDDAKEPDASAEPTD